MIKSSTGEVCSPNDDIKALDLHGTNALRARLLQIQADSGTGEEALLAEADIAVAEEKAKLLTPEQKIAGAEAQIEAMHQWLIQDGTYSPDEVDEITQGLSVEYDPDTDQVVVNGSLFLISLTSAAGLTLPDTVGGSLSLNGLTSAEGLTLPTSVGGHLDLGLTSAEGLTLPTSVAGDLSLGGLTSAEGLTLPTSVGGHLYLTRLTNAGGLTLPTSVGGGLFLSSLTSARGLTLPDSVGGNLDLSGLTSLKGLTLPTSVGILTLPTKLRHLPRLLRLRPDLASKVRHKA